VQITAHWSVNYGTLESSLLRSGYVKIMTGDAVRRCQEIFEKNNPHGSSSRHSFTFSEHTKSGAVGFCLIFLCMYNIHDQAQKTRNNIFDKIFHNVPHIFV
jgi:hypothetical protein